MSDCVHQRLMSRIRSRRGRGTAKMQANFSKMLLDLQLRCESSCGIHYVRKGA